MCPLRSIAENCSGRFAGFLACWVILLFSMGPRASGQLTGPALEGATTIGDKGLMLSGNFSTILSPGLLRLNGAIGQPGVKLGLGFKDRIDIKFYYSRWAVRGSVLQRNVFQLITKVTDEQHVLALYLPFGLIHSKYQHAYSETGIGKVWMISPRLIAIMLRKRNFDLCIIPYIELLKERSCRPFITGGMNLGIGIFSLAERLSLRLEGGIDLRTLAEGYPCCTAGVGLNYIFQTGK